MRKTMLIIMLFLMAGLVGTASAANPANIITGYEAGPDGGGPADINPVFQGWTATEIAAGTDGDADGLIDPPENAGPFVPDGTTGWNAWQINDQMADSSLDGPRYNIPMTAEIYQSMYDSGWIFTK